MYHQRESLPFSPLPSALSALQTYLSPARLGSYMNEAKQDVHLALRLHRWNAQLCETLYVPSQMVEIGFRNHLHEVMSNRFSVCWPLLFNSPALRALPAGARDQIRKAAQKINRKPHTTDAIVANLTFGFWCRMLDDDYDTVLWRQGIHHSFPLLPPDMDRAALREHMMAIRDFRNRVAHHEPVFSKGPQRHFGMMVQAIAWMSPEAHDYIKLQAADFHKVHAARPR